MSKGLKPATGAATFHGPNKQNERAKGATSHPFANHGDMTQGNKWKSRVNPNPPNVDNAKNTKPRVPMAPKINAEASGKRVVMSGASANKHTSTFQAPRSGGGGGGVTDVGYTKLGKV